VNLSVCFPIRRSVASSSESLRRGQRLQIPPGMVVGEDPEDDARRFRHTENGVTLITQKMLERLT
jgi:hypothetical protein